MFDHRRQFAFAAALLRLTLGTIFLAHSVVLKLFTFGLPGTAAYFRSVGLPGWTAYLTFFVEAIGGVLLVFGIGSRIAAAALVPFLLGAWVTVHAKNGWSFSAPGGGWEYLACLIMLCLIQVLLGDGAFAVAPWELPGTSQGARELDSASGAAAQ